MSFGGLFDGEIPYSRSAMPAGAIPQRCVAASSLSKPAFSSPGLSLALANMEGQGERIRVINAMGSGAVGGVAGRDLDVAVSRKREDENESRSESDHVDGGSSDDLDQQKPRKKKRYHRHTPQQIQELEALFKECPHPDEKQRLELSKRLHLETRQVKFWFQNRRTQMKTQLERHENAILRQENDKLRAENLAIREAARNPICTNCGGPAVLGEVSLEEQHLRLENARLKEELDRVTSLAGKFLGKPFSLAASLLPLPSISSSPLDLAVGSNGFPGLGPGVTADFATGVSSPLGSVITPSRHMGSLVGVDDKSLYLELALAAMEELLKMAHMEEPLWVPSLDGGGRETLNIEEHQRLFPRCTGMKPVGSVSEATRESGLVIISSMALVDTLMDAARWTDMFPCMIARAATTEVICSGMNATRHGALQLMHAELQVLSPLVPVREINFLRFCKQLAEGTWAVVDVSIEGSREDPSALPNTVKCRRLPSGCVVQDMPNGYSKVTWVEHTEYDEAAVHPLYRPLLRSGLALGAPRWLASLQRHCQCVALVSDPSTSALITPAGKRSMLKLARRMTETFCAGVCASAARKWRALPGEQRVGTVEGAEVRVLARHSVDEPGEPAGVVLSAATAVWLPWVAPGRVFDFLRDEGLRSEWDILSNGGPMQEMARIGKGPGQANAVSLLRASAVNVTQSSMLILQETCTDASGSIVVYAPVDVPAMHLVMSGGDSSCVALLPSGFVVMPYAAQKLDGGGEGSLLTVAFQILVDSQPTAKLTMESGETVNNLISCTVHKIKAALHCETA